MMSDARHRYHRYTADDSADDSYVNFWNPAAGINYEAHYNAMIQQPQNPQPYGADVMSHPVPLSPPSSRPVSCSPVGDGSADSTTKLQPLYSSNPHGRYPFHVKADPDRHGRSSFRRRNSQSADAHHSTSDKVKIH